MIKLHYRVFAFILLLCTAAVLRAQDADPHQADRAQLRELMGEIESAINNHDLAKIKSHIHPDAIITFQDAKVARGVGALEEYFEDKLGGESAVLKGFSTEADVDAPATFYDNVAVAYGHSNDKFVFATGNEIKLVSRWTATLRKEAGQWSVIALHFSANMFDNPLLNAAKQKLVLFSLLAFILGLIAAFGAQKLLCKRQR